MPFEKGNDLGRGRPNGSVNKITKTVRETFAEVFNEIQKDPNVCLSAFAKKYPKEFYAIASKLIPTELIAKVTQTNINVVRDGSKSSSETLRFAPSTGTNIIGSEEV